MPCSRILRRAAALLAAAALAAGCASPVSEKELQQAIDERPTPPPYPRFDQLVPADLGGGFDYFIDPSSISIAARSVVRYTVVARSPGGATNVSFEGLLCESRQRRLYALGREDGTWSAARDSEWADARNSTGSYYATLADYYFCPDKKPVADPAEAVRALRLGGHPASSLRAW